MESRKMVLMSLERWYYLQGSNGDTDIENIFGNSVWEAQGE